MRTSIITAMFVIAATVAGVSEEVVKVTASPGNAFGPITVTIRTTIEPHPDNREWALVWDSAEGESGARTRRQLEGDQSPKTWSDRIKLGPGEYVIQATVVRVHDGKPSYYVARTQLNVLEPG